MQDYTDYFAMHLSMNVEQLLGGHFSEDTTQVAAQDTCLFVVID